MGGLYPFHLCNKASRPAEVDIRVSWETKLVEDRSRQVTGSVEIPTNYAYAYNVYIAIPLGAIWTDRTLAK
jgi:hypothetical protein